MKSIEPSNPEHDDCTTKKIREFWSENVNAERIMDKNVSEHKRGQEGYFSDLEQQRYRSHQHLIPWIKSMTPGKSVLEIGCGIGLDSFTIAKHGMLLTSMDLTDIGVNTAKNRFNTQGVSGSFLAANACTLPFKDHSFDYIYSFGVLHHVADTKQSIKEVYRVLHTNGEALIMLYNRISLNELIHRITRIPFEEKSKLCPVVRRYSKTEIKDLFHDFSSVDIQLEYVYGEGYGKIFRFTPRWLYKILSHYLGWHIMIRATK